MKLINYLKVLLNMDKQCEELRRRAFSFFQPRVRYAREKWYCYTPYYRQVFDPIKRVIEVSNIFGIHWLEVDRDFLLKSISDLEEPEKARDRNFVDSTINEIIKVFGEIKTDAYELTKNLDSTKQRRLNEAIHCFLNRCFYSSVIMSVSVIESKLLDLMKQANPEKSEQLDKLTLGQLINEYLQHETEYNQVIPKKYKPLLELCNTYRVFSAHPKAEKITTRVATSILNLTFEFLTDKELA